MKNAAHLEETSGVEQQANLRVLHRMGVALDRYESGQDPVHAKCYQVCAQVARKLLPEASQTPGGCAVIFASSALLEMVGEPPAYVEGITFLAALRTRRC